MIIFYVKSRSDVFVSFSKLDGLIAISSFQKFKIKENSISSDVGLLENFLLTRNQLPSGVNRETESDIAITVSSSNSVSIIKEEEP